MSQIPDENVSFENSSELQMLLKSVEIITTLSGCSEPPIAHLVNDEIKFKEALFDWALQIAENYASNSDLKTPLLTLYMACRTARTEARSEYEMGRYSLYGWVIDKDIVTAVKRFEKAGELGYAKAYHLLGNLYMNGDYVSKNVAKAQAYYEKGCELDYGAAYFNLGDIYAYGRNGVTDLVKAFNLFKYGADNCNCPQCQNRVGSAYHLGRGVAVNKALAFRYWKKSAENDPNFIFASFNLGTAYRYGIGTQKNLSMAVECYKNCLRINPNDESSKKALFETECARDVEEAVQHAEMMEREEKKSSGGCYVATAVYGSYDCPEVWTLRRYRDNTLASTWYGRAFIRTYYAISPTLVKWFGNTQWFKKMWQGKLDRMVAKLQANGVESTPYEDRNW